MKYNYRIESVLTSTGREWVVIVNGRREATMDGHEFYFRTRASAREYVGKHKQLAARAEGAFIAVGAHIGAE